MKNTIHMVSVSGGKDSTATLLLALKQFPDTTFAVFADTGNEHESTLEYLDALQTSLGIRIERIKADFSDRFERRREWILNKWPEHGVPAERCERAAALMQPSGNPFLDLCMLKGRFPSRMAQFCTQELKTKPLMEYALWLIDTLAADVWSWQGVRRDESLARANAKGFEDLTGGLFAFRPIAGWNAQETVDFVRLHGAELNPLYSQGMNRVGCMPCVNTNKAELAEISRRFPAHVDRISEWEHIVSDVAKRGASTFFHKGVAEYGVAGMSAAEIFEVGNVHKVVQWARTFRGGRVEDPEWGQPAPACASSYGLCE